MTAARQRLAIVGTGISGMVAAYLLHRDHDITVFEAGDRIGGHTNTVDVEWEGRCYAVDTGFIVFNHRTYPNFVRLLSHLGVAYQPSDMSFSVVEEARDFEYNGTSLNALFGQRRNLLRPSFHRMLREILRCNREALEFLEHAPDEVTLGDFLREGRYSREFIEHYIVPMGAAVWSADPAGMFGFPAARFFRFFANHGFLSLTGRPRWQVVSGGARRYAEALTRPFAHRIRLSAPVERISRTGSAVIVQAGGAPAERFDGVVIATHSDQALKMLDGPTAREREILGAIPYQPNEAVLHTDTSLLPRRRRCWAAWNYHIPARPADRVCVTYDMNTLQRLDAPVRFLVTLNHTAGIDPSRVLRRIRYHHPIFTQAGVAAQRRHGEISGHNRTWYCGAYWSNGFHEDGVLSALAVARDFGLGMDDLPRLAARPPRKGQHA